MPPIWKPPALTWPELLRRTWRQFRRDRILDQSAKCAFYFLLSAFPLLFFLVAVLGMALRSGPVPHEILHRYIALLTPASVSGLIDATLAEIMTAAGPFKLSAALLLTWWSAQQGMRAVIEALNIAYDVPESRVWWKKNLVASWLTLASLALIAMALVLVIYGGELAGALAALLGYGKLIAAGWRLLQWALLLAFVLAAFHLIYLYAPNARTPRWTVLLPGTVLGVGLWLAVSFGFKVYLMFFDRYTVTYGSLGAVIILLLWFYLSSTALLLGGELNSEIVKALPREAQAGAANRSSPERGSAYRPG